MKKNIFLFIVVAFYPFFASAQVDSTITTPDSPEIKFETETIDYGTIENNSNGDREFKFTNIGKEPLIISQCIGSCGCTVPQWPTNAIESGSSGIILVHYTTSRTGPIDRSITVYSNAVNSPKILRVTGNVEFKNAPIFSNQLYSVNAKVFKFMLATDSSQVNPENEDFKQMIDFIAKRTKEQNKTSITVEVSSCYNPSLNFESNYDLPRKKIITTTKLLNSTFRKHGIALNTFYKEPVIAVQGTGKEYKRKKKAAKFRYVKVTID